MFYDLDLLSGNPFNMSRGPLKKPLPFMGEISVLQLCNCYDVGIHEGVGFLQVTSKALLLNLVYSHCVTCSILGEFILLCVFDWGTFNIVVKSRLVKNSAKYSASFVRLSLPKHSVTVTNNL